MTKIFMEVNILKNKVKTGGRQCAKVNNEGDKNNCGKCNIM